LTKTLDLATMCATATSPPMPQKYSLELRLGETWIQAKGIRPVLPQSPDFCDSLPQMLTEICEFELISGLNRHIRASLQHPGELAHLWTPLFELGIVRSSLSPPTVLGHRVSSPPARFCGPKPNGAGTLLFTLIFWFDSTPPRVLIRIESSNWRVICERISSMMSSLTESNGLTRSCPRGRWRVSGPTSQWHRLAVV
jgi:hypothetical protein